MVDVYSRRASAMDTTWCTARMSLVDNQGRRIPASFELAGDSMKIVFGGAMVVAMTPIAKLTSSLNAKAQLGSMATFFGLANEGHVLEAVNVLERGPSDTSNREVVLAATSKISQVLQVVGMSFDTSKKVEEQVRL